MKMRTLRYISSTLIHAPDFYFTDTAVQWAGSAT